VTAPGLPAGPGLPGGPPLHRHSASPPEQPRWRVGDLVLRSAPPSCLPRPPGAGCLARLVPPAEPGSLSAARDFVRKCLADWGMTELTWDATTIVSELLTNAITHAAPPLPAPARGMALQVVLQCHEGRLAIVVTDPSARPPYRIVEPLPGPEGHAVAECADDPVLAESGRGLRIVAGLSREWGWAPLDSGGKAVWAVLDASRP
jgi:anti-sigma regulatory factor (Ser/Thr protein kinase)